MFACAEWSELFALGIVCDRGFDKPYDEGDDEVEGDGEVEFLHCWCKLSRIRCNTKRMCEYDRTRGGKKWVEIGCVILDRMTRWMS